MRALVLSLFGMVFVPAVNAARLSFPEVVGLVSQSPDVRLAEGQLELAQAESSRAEALRASAGALGALSLTLGTEVRAVSGSAPEGTLPEAFELLPRLERHSEVAAAQLAVREAAEARFEALPSGTLSLGYTRTTGEQGLQLGASIGTDAFQPSLSASYLPSTEAPAASSLSASVEASIALDPALPAALEAAAMEVALARAQLGAARRLVRLKVATRQRELEAAETGLTVSDRQLALSRQLLAGVRTRFKLGLVAPLELRRAELALLEARLLHARAEDAVLLARLRLARALAFDLWEVL